MHHLRKAPHRCSKKRHETHSLFPVPRRPQDKGIQENGNTQKLKQYAIESAYTECAAPIVFAPKKSQTSDFATIIGILTIQPCATRALYDKWMSARTFLANPQYFQHWKQIANPGKYGLMVLAETELN